VDIGAEPIEDDEILFRRVPASMAWYDPESGILQSEAFAPRKDDLTGLSVSCRRYKSVEDAARGRPGKQYFVAVLIAGGLRRNGIRIEPRPLPDDPGHSELPDLNYHHRKESRTLELQRILVELCQSIEGPFPSQISPIP
jgi:hypothetical protein